MHPLGKIADLQRRTLTVAEIDKTSVVVVALAGEFRVVMNRCPHQQAEILHEGTVADRALTCPLHGRTFDLTDGRCRNGAGRLTFVPSQVVGDTLWAGPIPEPEFPAF